MTVKHVTETEFSEKVLQAKHPVLVDFYAEWCGPCKMMAPILDEVAKERTDIEIVKVDVDSLQELHSTYQVGSIPTFILFKDGQPIAQAVGAIGKSGVMSLLAKAA